MCFCTNHFCSIVALFLAPPSPLGHCLTSLKTWVFHVLRLSYVFHSDDWCRLLSDNNLVITSLLHTQASTPSLWFFTTHFALLSDIINLSLTCPVFVNLFPICAKCNLHREGICVCVLLLLYFHCLKRNVWHLADLQKYLLNEWIYKGTD